MNGLARKLLRENRSILLFLALMFVFRSACADWMYVPSGSMNPTLMDGDRILVNKHAYGLRVPFSLIRLTEGQDPARGDIAVFESPANGRTLVKRVMGVPGDLIRMEDERLSVNGRPAAYADAPPELGREMLAEFRNAPHIIASEDLGGFEHMLMWLPERPAMRSFGPVRVPAGQYLMLGDNRDDSADSRYIGFVPRRLIFGKATAVVASFNADRDYLPRVDRTFAKLN